MRKAKEIVIKTYRENDVLVETTVQFYYDSWKEKAHHTQEYVNMGWNDSGQIRENIGTVANPVLVWFGSYYKYEVKSK